MKPEKIKEFLSEIKIIRPEKQDLFDYKGTQIRFDPHHLYISNGADSAMLDYSEIRGIKRMDDVIRFEMKTGTFELFGPKVFHINWEGRNINHKISNIAFVELVNQMRYAQRMYFATREIKWLNRAKELEKKVDEITNDMLFPKLFDD